MSDVGFVKGSWQTKFDLHEKIYDEAVKHSLSGGMGAVTMDDQYWGSWQCSSQSLEQKIESSLVRTPTLLHNWETKAELNVLLNNTMSISVGSKRTLRGHP